MAFALVYLVLVLLLVVGLNRGFFARLGFTRTLQLLLVWGVVFAGGVLVVRLLGLA
ncbi:MAG: hypothetical protein ACK4MT_01980 [Thermaurantiacus tibetensis]|uniref:hypothetical protein n=1 Tax=Thermaurantiacus tibetensis TaxID=2759035 RepID=UPI00188EE643|nr:hypothetical protein [Thermaurantiacus tibetensis]